ncbi:MAG: class II glutamine amidotransferase [Thermoplasmata archaeon]
MDCRMFAFSGNVMDAINIQKSLAEAAKNDIFDGNKSHGDGWGSAVISNDQELLIRRKIPIFEDSFMDIIKNLAGKIVLISHARLASETEEKRGWMDSHPFRIFKENETFYIEHNGYIDKYLLNRKFGIEIKNFTDTEAFSFLLQKLNGDFIENIKNIIDVLHEGTLAGTLNLICAGYDYKNKRKICYYSDFNSKKEDYLRLFEFKKDESFSVMSSTVAYYLNIIDENMNYRNNNVKMIEKGKLFVYEEG